MTTILCATRGGEASYPTQDRAIALAHERGAELLFIYVSDVEFLSHVASPVLVDVATEMEHMGEFLLLLAKERAEKAGAKADTLVRSGGFRQALLEAIRDHGVSVLVLGRPGAEGSIAEETYLERLVADLAQETGVETVLV